LDIYINNRSEGKDKEILFNLLKIAKIKISSPGSLVETKNLILFRKLWIRGFNKIKNERRK
jgi:hypothetical protein